MADSTIKMFYASMPTNCKVTLFLRNGLKLDNCSVVSVDDSHVWFKDAEDNDALFSVGDIAAHTLQHNEGSANVDA